MKAKENHKMSKQAYVYPNKKKEKKETSKIVRNVEMSI